MSAAPWLHPEWLPALAVGWLALAAALAWAAWRARRRARRLVGAPDAGGRGLGADVLALLALAAVAAALLGPRAGTRSIRVPASGVDVVVLVDVSRSMDARDVPPSRLDRARAAAQAALSGLAPGDRAALAAFAGRGVLATPLTTDHAALRTLLPALDTELIRPPASRLAAGMRAALGAFEPGSRRPRVVLVLSDGEQPDGGRGGDLALPEAVRAGARVVAVPLGTEAGTTIPGPGGPLRDRTGRTVTTAVRPEALARLARATDGALLATDRFGAVDAAELVAALRRDAARAPGEWTERRVTAVQVAPLAAAGLALLLLPALRAAWPRGRPARGVALACAAALLVGAGGDPPPPRALLELGVARAEAGRWEEAERAFRAAALGARDPGQAALAYYDAGVAALRAQRLEAARDAFFEALALDPGDEAARFNLEWTLRALAAGPPALPEPEESETSDPASPERGPAGLGEDASDGRSDTPRAPGSARGQAAPQPPPGPAAQPGAAADAGAPPPLDAEAAERWLARTEDDAGRALRTLDRGGRGPRGVSPW